MPADSTIFLSFVREIDACEVDDSDFITHPNADCVTNAQMDSLLMRVIHVMLSSMTKSGNSLSVRQEM